MNPPKTTHPDRFGMSLFEVLIVISVIGILMAITAPAFITLGPAKQGAILDLKVFIEDAQHAAIRDQRDIYIAFADDQAPDDAQWRRYAYFTPIESSATESLLTRPLRQVSKWQNLPNGVVFASGEHFDADAGSFKTLLDASIRREFEFFDAKGVTRNSRLSFLMFNAKGGIAIPPIVEADSLHLGIADGFVDSDGKRIFQGVNNEGLPRTECLGINFYTGKARIITR